MGALMQMPQASNRTSVNGGHGTSKHVFWVPAITCASVRQNPPSAAMAEKSGPVVNRMPPRRTVIVGTSHSPSSDSLPPHRSYSVSDGAHQPPAATSDPPASRD